MSKRNKTRQVEGRETGDNSKVKWARMGEPRTHGGRYKTDKDELTGRPNEDRD
jgi:hypothetical protein